MNNPAATSPITRRVRAYFAPVARATGTPTLWDPAGIATFNVNAPPEPWVDLGWCTGFARRSGTKLAPLLAGTPATTLGQVRTEVDAQVSLEFESWGKLQLALTAGVQQINVLGSAAAVPVAADSTATVLDLGAATAGFSAGDLVVVDLDYTGTTGFVGSGISGGYVQSSDAIGNDPDYVRRISLNVARVASVGATQLTLSAPLPAGAPVAGMQAGKVLAFCDREGGSFFQEWSALFVVEGQQGDRIVFHYPRLQSMAGAAETAQTLAPSLEKLRLTGTFRALPVVDATDGERIVCYRSYLPALLRAV